LNHWTKCQGSCHTVERCQSIRRDDFEHSRKYERRREDGLIEKRPSLRT
jgi:hypothetical protein